MPFGARSARSPRLFFGLKAAVLAIVLQAVVKIGGRALRNQTKVAMAALSFLAIFVFDVPFPVIVLGAALIGWLGGRAGLAAFTGGGQGHGAGDGTVADEDTLLGTESPSDEGGRSGSLLGIAAIALVLWLGPTAILLAFAGPENAFAQIAVFFSQMAVVTFGGAYAVLAYVAQAAVDTYGWLAPGEMLDGLGMAETTPGPLIMVTQFVGFMGAYRDPGAFDPLTAGILGAALTTWVTFAPCFLWIFVGAPHVERLRANAALSAALGAITAAVVGVILNLALWFAMHTLFREVEPAALPGLALDVPVWPSLDPVAAALAVAALLAVFRFNVGVVQLLLASAAVGVGLDMAGLRVLG